jgi:hypothetical protein
MTQPCDPLNVVEKRVREYVVRQRFEVSASGVDDALVGLSSDPFSPTGFPGVATGLRVPAFVNSNDNRYLFLLASRSMPQGINTRLRGWRQLVTIGINLPTDSGPPSRVMELEVTTPTFRFPDGNWSFHIVREEPQGVDSRLLPTDMANFSHVSADQSSLLYQSATFAAPTGLYMVGMTSYTMPRQRMMNWKPVANLGNVHDLRTSWRTPEAWDSLDEQVLGGSRISLYATVLQTNPATRPNLNLPSPFPLGTPEGMPPEEAFIANFTSGGGDFGPIKGPIVWRIGGSLIFEDE